MRNTNLEILKTTDHLPEHRRLLETLFTFFRPQAGIVGAFTSGSLAAGGMDNYSDLDLGFLCESQEARLRIWNSRWDWNIADWFHRFDADHIKPYFVIYFFEPDIHVDLNFYLQGDLPKPEGGPFGIAWDKSEQLSHWVHQANARPAPRPDWSNVVHEDERFWAWVHWSCSHAKRGEFYDAATYFKDLRSIIEVWHARLSGQAFFDTRRVEQREPESFVREMKDCFPEPSIPSLRRAYLRLIEIQKNQHSQLSKLLGNNWRVSQATRVRLEKMVASL